MANTKVTGDLIASSTIATGNIADNAVTSAKISGITTAHITEGSNLYYTDARARAAVSVSGNALSYNSSTGVITSNFEESPAFTGNVDVAGNITVGGNDSILAENNLRFKSSGAAYIDHNTTGQAINFRTSVSSSLDTTPLVLLGANVGIGTSSPSHRLHVVSAGNGEIKAERTSGAAMLIQTQSALGRFGTTTNHNLQFMANSNGWMTITTAGNVGIGLTSPAVKLEIQDSTHTTMKIRSGNNDNILFAQALQSDEARIGTDTNSAISFFTNTGRRMTITTSGLVGIGTNLPQSNLHISTSATNAPIRLQNDNGSGSTANYVLQTDSSGLGNNGFGIYDVAQSAYRFVINGSGNIGIGVTSPTQKLDVAGNIVIHNSTNAPYIDFVESGATSDSKARITMDQIDTDNGELIFSTEGSGTLTTALTLDRNQNTIVSGPFWIQEYIYHHGDADTYIRALSNEWVLRTGGSDRLTISDSNTYFTNTSVGIGTTSPAKTLDIRTDNGVLIKGASGTTNAHLSFLPASGGREYAFSNDGSSFYIKDISADVTRMYFHYNGNIGIATTSPEEKLNVIGSVLISNNEFYKVESTTGANYKIAGLTNGNVIQIGAIDYTSAGTVFAGGDNISITTGGASGTTRMKISSSGNVGIGTTSPDSKLHIYTDTKDSTVFKIRNYLATANGSTYQNYSELKFISDANGNAPAGIRHYANLWHNVDSALAFFTNQHGGSYAERMRIDGDGYLRMASGTGGIQFNGDTSTANALDDYEEGTFTPAIGDGTYTYSYRRGHYQKVGNTVHIHIGLKINQASSVGTGVARITGLPFAGMSWGSYQEPHERCGVAGLCVTANLSYNLSFYVSNSSAQLNGRTSANNADTQVNSNQVWQNGTFIKLQLSYTVS